jgi:HTH domain
MWNGLRGRRVGDPAGDRLDHPLLHAMIPVADALGASLVVAAEVDSADIPLRWGGELVGGLRLPQLHGALSRLIEQVERELGGHLRELSREDKQRAVRLLDERGAFLLRRSVEDVADALCVSRITVYNYLNAIRP